MTDKIRKLTGEAIKHKKLSRSDIAERSGLRADHIDKLLNGRRVGTAETWTQLLDALGLELVVKPKGSKQ